MIPKTPKFGLKNSNISRKKTMPTTASPTTGSPTTSHPTTISPNCRHYSPLVEKFPITRGNSGEFTCFTKDSQHFPDNKGGIVARIWTDVQWRWPFLP